MIPDLILELVPYTHKGIAWILLALEATKEFFQIFRNNNALPKRTIIMRGIDIYSGEKESNTSESESKHEEESNGEDVYPCDEKLLMVIRLLNNQPSVQQIS